MKPHTVSRIIIAIVGVIGFFLVTLPAVAEEATIPIPDQGWAIHVDAPSLSGAKESKGDGEYSYMANGGLFNISFFVEKPHGKGMTHQDCYNFYWPRASHNPMIDTTTVKVSQTEKFVRVQYDVVATVEEETYHVRNVNYYFVYNGKWMDVHISLVLSSDDDDAVLAAFDKGLSYGPEE